MYSEKETGSSYQYTWVKGTLATHLSRIKNSLKFAVFNYCYIRFFNYCYIRLSVWVVFLEVELQQLFFSQTIFYLSNRVVGTYSLKKRDSTLILPQDINWPPKLESNSCTVELVEWTVSILFSKPLKNFQWVLTVSRIPQHLNRISSLVWQLDSLSGKFKKYTFLLLTT